MASERSPKQAKTVLDGGRYELVRRLGAGGMGEVFLALDRMLDLEVVIKVPHKALFRDKQFAARFRREIKSLIKLRHKNVVRILDVGDQKGLPFVAMPYLSGGTLEDRFSDGPLPESSLVDWLPAVATALDHIHSLGFIHRDIKPANILFDEDGIAYVGDFGIAKSVSNQETSETYAGQLTGTGLAMGTPDYMAPELVMSENVDHLVDQYALAITVFQALSGRLPFEAATPAAVLVKQSTMPPPSLKLACPSASEAVVDAVDRALRKIPGSRFESCGEFTAHILGVEFERSASNSPPIQFECPNCGLSLPLKTRHAGKKLRCPECSVILVVSSDFKKVKQVQKRESTQEVVSPKASTSISRKNIPQKNRQAIATEGRRIRTWSLLAVVIAVGTIGVLIAWKSYMSPTAPEAKTVKVMPAIVETNSRPSPAPAPAKLVVSIVDARQSPVGGVDATLILPDGKEQPISVDQSAQATFSLDGVAMLRVAAPGFLERQIDVNSGMDNLILVLEKNLTLKGTLAVSAAKRGDSNLSRPDATIVLENTETAFVVESQVEPDGAFRFEALRPGRYQLIVNAEGFYTTKLPLSVVDKNVDVNVRLRAKNPILIAAVSRLFTAGWGPTEAAKKASRQEISVIQKVAPDSAIARFAVTLTQRSQGIAGLNTDPPIDLSEYPSLRDLPFGLALHDAVFQEDRSATFQLLDVALANPPDRADVANLLGRTAVVLRSVMSQSKSIGQQMDDKLKASLSEPASQAYLNGVVAANNQKTELEKQIAVAKQDQDAQEKSKIEAQQQETEKTLKAARERIAELQQTKIEYDNKGNAEFARLDQQIARETVRKNRAGADLATAGQAVNQLNLSMNNLQRQIAQLQALQPETPAQAASNNSQIAQLNTQGATLQSQAAAQKTVFISRSMEHDSSLQEIKKLVARKTSIAAEYSRELAKMNAEYFELERSIGVLEKSLKQPKSEQEPTKKKKESKLEKSLRTPATFLPDVLPLWRDAILDELKQGGG